MSPGDDERPDRIIVQPTPDGLSICGQEPCVAKILILRVEVDHPD